MRTKRSRDSRLVDKFQRTREEMQAVSQPKRPAIQNSATKQLHHGEEEEDDDDDEEEDLQVSLEDSSLCLKVKNEGFVVSWGVTYVFINVFILSL